MGTNNIFIAVGVFLVATLLSCKAQQTEQAQPNIIFIMTDDHAYQALSAYSDKLIETPNIDRLALEGAIFTRATVTNSICAPSRAVMLTGKHSFMNGKVDNSNPFNWEQDNFAKRLQNAGYQTALIGKIHLQGSPQGFDYSAVLSGQGDYYNPDFIFNGETKRIHGYVTSIISQLALDWLKERDADKPFLLLYHQKAPHREWLPEPKYFKEYVQKKFREPETLFDDYSGRGEAARAAEMRVLHDKNWSGDSKIYPEVMERLGILESTKWGLEQYSKNMDRMDKQQRATWDSIYGPINEEFERAYPTMTEKELTSWRFQRYMQDYLACIASVDDGVGDMLNFLEENDLAENTIVVYTSDQGFYLGEHGWFDKRFMYEESLRMPLLMRFPKEIKAQTEIGQLVQNLDFAPTFLDYAGVPIPEDMQGESFRELVAGRTHEWRDAAYYTYYAFPAVHMVKRHYGITTERYKLIHYYYDINEWELYDIEEDPQELRNVYNDPAYAEVKENLHKRLDELRAKYGDSDENNQKYINQLPENLRKR